MKEEISGEWFVGFIEGEGNFHVSLIKNYKSSSWKFPFEYYPILQFRIFLREDDLDVLNKIKDFLKIGKIYKKKLDYNRKLGFKARDQYYYVLSSLKDLLKLKKVLDKHPFHTKKRKDKDIFFRVLKLKLHKKHLVKEGYEEIINLTKNLNSGDRENFKKGNNRKIYILKDKIT